ncbi:MAG TPA: hypothetical protein VIF14_01310 [Alphaproteobacteria bacterium]|jgi:predicted flap endonuclease-1-like 5' DNA nuclease
MVWLLTEILVFVAAAAVFGGLIGLGLAGTGANRRAAAFQRAHEGLVDQLRRYQRSQGTIEAKAAAQTAAEAAARGDLEARLVDMETAAGQYRARAEAAERRLRARPSPADVPELIEAVAPAAAAAIEVEVERAKGAAEIESLRAQLALAERLRAKAEHDLAAARGRAEETAPSSARAGAGAPPAASAAPLAAVEEGERPPGLAAPRGGKADDLRRIKGIGPRNEGVLNSLGIYHYEQIAALTPANVAWLDAYLKFPGRIARDDWVGQAKALLGVELQPSDKVHPEDAGA